MDQVDPNSDRPAPFFCGAIYFLQPPQQLHRLVVTSFPPLLSDRAGGWESRSILMGTLLDSFQSYGSMRPRSPVPEAAVSGKRDSSSVAAVWAIHFYRLESIHPKSPVESESLPRLYKHHFTT